MRFTGFAAALFGLLLTIAVRGATLEREVTLTLGLHGMQSFAFYVYRWGPLDSTPQGYDQYHVIVNGASDSFTHLHTESWSNNLNSTVTPEPPNCYNARITITVYSGLFAGSTTQESYYQEAGVQCLQGPPEPPVLDNGQDCENPGGYGCSPIVIDLGHDGYQLTGATEGVRFDIDADGVQENISWTAPGSNDAFLWLDENGNGNVDNGSELFGDAEYPNGFEKLRRYDSRSLGGNGDGMIDPSDSVWNNLMLWIDESHDGVSQAGETLPLNETDFVQIALRYQVIGRNDAYGNQFRYKSKAYYRDLDGNVKSDHVFDIVFVSAQ